MEYFLVAYIVVCTSIILGIVGMNPNIGHLGMTLLCIIVFCGLPIVVIYAIVTTIIKQVSKS